MQFADVSGMEHLDMLMTRSEIAKNELHLSDEERERVLKADRQLLQRAKQFYKSIQRIADLASWRRDENIPVTQWWWYDDAQSHGVFRFCYFSITRRPWQGLAGQRSLLVQALRVIFQDT